MHRDELDLAEKLLLNIIITDRNFVEELGRHNTVPCSGEELELFIKVFSYYEQFYESVRDLVAFFRALEREN